MTCYIRPVTTLDPFGEDLAENLARVGALAERWCHGCGDYHVIFVARRAVQRQLAESDRTAVEEAIFLAASKGRASGRVDIFVAGAADSGILATAVRAVERAGPAESHFMVVDLCRTPLELCRDFATRRGIAFSAETTDLTSDETPRSADIIVAHSLFRHLPVEVHVATLKRFARWLKPGGRIVISHRLEDESDAAQRPRERVKTGTLLRQALAEGRLRLSEPVEALEARLARRDSKPPVHRTFTASRASLDEAFAKAGLEAERVDYVEGLEAGIRRRFVFTLRPAG